MLLHQVGRVKIGEVVRYTVTYHPSRDRILPPPECFHLRIKNTSAIALRAAFVHGPYTLTVAAYPATFRTDRKFEHAHQYGVPEFEPMLKAGGTWTCELLVPEHIRQRAGEGDRLSHDRADAQDPPDAENSDSVSWVIEIASQVIFSASAAVHYEVLLARDEKSLHLSSIPVLGGSAARAPQPGELDHFQTPSPTGPRRPVSPAKGVFSHAIQLRVEDTAALWNKPEVPGWHEIGWLRGRYPGMSDPAAAAEPDNKLVAGTAPANRHGQKRIHLVILTHGLHSNLGADMLYMKESIDAGARKAKADAKARKEREKAGAMGDKPTDDSVHDVQPSGQDNKDKQADRQADEDEDEEVVVRGYPGNATKTERGIKYLGKRLARYVLSMTYPDQPFLPTAKAASEAIVYTLQSTPQKPSGGDGQPVHKHSSIRKKPAEALQGQRMYKITKISFIGHSLGGLVQMYTVAYIQKHSPQFFSLIKPINFVTMASPLLGLNHENPLYVKFALDFGLVGRTGQDLGLTWRAPTIARHGWGAIVSNLGENAHKRVYGDSQAESKPLLRILPTGPAHTALKKFRNRTIYSNVVNDGIVPLRTSCLLFLDWQGLGRVEKARREAGLVETVVGFGWAELTGTGMTSLRQGSRSPSTDGWKPHGPWPLEASPAGTSPPSGKSTPTGFVDSHEVPQPSDHAILEDDRASLRSVPDPFPDTNQQAPTLSDAQHSASTTNNTNPFTGFFNLFRKSEPPKEHPFSQKQTNIYRRGQTLKIADPSSPELLAAPKSRVTTGQELAEDGPEGALTAPPKTTFFESAGDVLNPKIPSLEFLLDPTRRARTIFHDRVYHPSDIPPPPLKKRLTSPLSIRRKATTPSSITGRTASPPAATATCPTSQSSSPYTSPSLKPRREDSLKSDGDYDDLVNTNPNCDPNDAIDSSQMRVEEKIARAYHRGLSWRKVLVKLPPDSHNNILVRRMFTNAFGWPVIHHLVEAHFGDTLEARTADMDEPGGERAKKPAEAPAQDGGETISFEEMARNAGDDDGQAVLHVKKAATGATDGGSDDTQSSEPSRSSPRKPSRRHSITRALLSRTLHVRTRSETREAQDTVSDLPDNPPSSGSHSISGRASGQRGASVFEQQQDQQDQQDQQQFTPAASAPSSPASSSSRSHGSLRGRFRAGLERRDSVAWSERDWQDSGEESEGTGEVGTLRSASRTQRGSGSGGEESRQQ